LAIINAVAWKILLIRWQSRAEPDAPANRVFNDQELMALRALSETTGQTLSAIPTVRAAVAVLASIGGHIKNNGDPGIIVLRRGLSQLSIAVRVLCWANTS